jgi:hypothetical protein
MFSTFLLSVMFMTLKIFWTMKLRHPFSGGSTLFKGFGDRLLSEVKKLVINLVTILVNNSVTDNR